MEIEFKKYQVEINEDSGVLYIHNKETGSTSIRISGLTERMPLSGYNLRRRGDRTFELVDITLFSNGKVVHM